jgi:hypothetical protein
LFDNEPCPERLQFTPLGSFVVAVSVAFCAAATFCVLDETVTVIVEGGGVVEEEGDDPQPLSPPNNKIVTIKCAAVRLFSPGSFIKFLILGGVNRVLSINSIAPGGGCWRAKSNCRGAVTS